MKGLQYLAPGLIALVVPAVAFTTSKPHSTLASAADDLTFVRVGTWNVLLVEDEYNPDYGTVLQGLLCGTDPTSPAAINCTKTRREHIWKYLDANEAKMDVIALQELEDGFLSLQPAASPWKLASRSNQCALFVHTSFSLEYNTNVSDWSLPTSGCDALPLVTVRSDVGSTLTIASIHVPASGVNMTQWYQEASTTLDIAGTLVFAGDWNHNLTEVKRSMYDWMGSFDHFLHNAPGSNPTARAYVTGFMPKVVAGVGGKSMGQFRLPKGPEGPLQFSATGAEPWQEVPASNPVNEDMSDHLLVVADFPI